MVKLQNDGKHITTNLSGFFMPAIQNLHGN